MKIAFKEWAVVVDALGSGAQILILRKGGIAEGHGGFKMDHSRFLLFPTRFHQQRESVVESAGVRFDAVQQVFPAENTVRLEFYAVVAKACELRGLDAARALKSQHIWKDEVIEKRFDWGGSHSICAIALRIYRLAGPAELPVLPEYSGCKSWMELAEDISTEGASPVLSDSEYELKLDAFLSALAPFPTLPAPPPAFS